MSVKIKISSLVETTLVFFILSLVFLYDVFNSVLSSLDELLGLVSFLVILYYVIVKTKIKLYRQEYYILLFLIIVAIVGLTSNLMTINKGYSTSVIAIIGDSINFFKAFITYFGIRFLSHKFNSKNVINRLSTSSVTIFWLLFTIIIIDLIFIIYPQPSRFGITSLQLFFQHPSRYGFAFIFIFLMLLPRYVYKKKTILIFIIIIGALSFRVKYLGFLLVTIFFTFYGKRLFKFSKKYFFIITSIVGLFSVWLFWDWIDMYFTFDNLETAWSRAVLLYYSAIIANDFYPFGTGFGTYSSFYSGLHYSWVYDHYGISKVYGISREYWPYLSDQYWPLVLGEFGYIGLISMFGVIISYISLFFNKAKESLYTNKYYYFISIILGMLMLLIDSTSDSIFTQQRAVVLFSYFALVINYSNESSNSKK